MNLVFCRSQFMRESCRWPQSLFPAAERQLTYVAPLVVCTWRRTKLWSHYSTFLINVTPAADYASAVWAWGWASTFKIWSGVGAGYLFCSSIHHREESVGKTAGSCLGRGIHELSEWQFLVQVRLSSWTLCQPCPHRSPLFLATELCFGTCVSHIDLIA